MEYFQQQILLRWETWENNEPDSFELKLTTILKALYNQWLLMAYDQEEPQRIPRIKPLNPDDSQPDIDSDMIQMLMMSPVSTDYHLRPFVGINFVNALIEGTEEQKALLEDCHIPSSYMEKMLARLTFLKIVL